MIVVIKCQLKVKCQFVKKSSPSFGQGVIAKDMDIGEWHNGAKCKPNELYCMNEHNNEKGRKGEMKRTWVFLNSIFQMFVTNNIQLWKSKVGVRCKFVAKGEALGYSVKSCTPIGECRTYSLQCRLKL